MIQRTSKPLRIVLRFLSIVLHARQTIPEAKDTGNTLDASHMIIGTNYIGMDIWGTKWRQLLYSLTPDHLATMLGGANDFPSLTPDYILAFQFSTWYPLFAHLSFKSTVIRPLETSFEDYLHSDRVFIPQGSENVSVQSHLSRASQFSLKHYIAA